MKKYYVYEAKVEVRYFSNDYGYWKKKVLVPWKCIGYLEDYKSVKKWINRNVYFFKKYLLYSFEIDATFDEGKYFVITSENKTPIKPIEIPIKKKTIDYEYRKDPVPNVNNHRWKFSHYYRTFKYSDFKNTISQREINDYRNEYPHAKVKVQKNSRNKLPSAWDDVVRSDYGNNNWKRYRKQQYRTN